MKKTSSIKLHFIYLLLTLFTANLIADDNFGYFSNPWTTVGLKDYPYGTRITPENKMLIGVPYGSKADMATVQIRFGKELKLLDSKYKRKLEKGWIPIVIIDAEDQKVKYDVRIWASPKPTQAGPYAFSWPIEGPDYLTWIWIRATNSSSAPQTAAMQIEQTGDFPKGYHPNPELNEPIKVSKTLQPGQTAQAIARIRWEPKPTRDEFSNIDPRIWYDKTIQYWQNLLASGAVIELPCQKATNALKSAHICQFIANDYGDLRDLIARML